MRLRCLDLFAGIGGFSLAASWMNWETVAWVEINEFCQQVLKKNFPEAKGYGDIKQFDGTKYRGAIDIITGGFHVNRSHPRESEKGRTITATSGRKCLESLEKFSRPTSWARMFLESLIGRKDWFSSRCVLTWKMKATRCNRLYFQLVPSTPRIEGIGFGLLHTPTETANQLAPSMTDKYSGGWGQLLPTPIVMDTNGRNLEKINQRRQRAKDKGYNGNGFGVTLNELAQRGMLPTPTTRDYRSDKSSPEWREARMANPKGKALPFLMDGLLNPLFVEEMMGYPIGWTELKPSVMPSSRKLHTKYSKQLKR